MIVSLPLSVLLIGCENPSADDSNLSADIQNKTIESDKMQENQENNTSSTDLKTADYDLNGVEFKMIYVEGGTFTMGNNERAKEEGTQVSNQNGEHQVTLSSYTIGETEVTRALWNEVMYGNHSNNDLDYPISSVTVPKCQEFIEKLNQKAHENEMLPGDQNFHMLTETQWKFASKGGNNSKNYIYSGSNKLSEVGWTSDDGGDVHPVKQKKANELGLYDMSGNVYEWVAEYAAPYSTKPQTNPCNTTNSDYYIKQGGSIYYNDNYRFTSTYRYFYSSTDYTISLRIGLS